MNLLPECGNLIHERVDTAIFYHLQVGEIFIRVVCVCVCVCVCVYIYMFLIYFRIDLQNSCKDSTESSHRPHT